MTFASRSRLLVFALLLTVTMHAQTKQPQTQRDMIKRLQAQIIKDKKIEAYIQTQLNAAYHAGDRTLMQSLVFMQQQQSEITIAAQENLQLYMDAINPPKGDDEDDEDGGVTTYSIGDSAPTPTTTTTTTTTSTDEKVHHVIMVSQ